MSPLAIKAIVLAVIAAALFGGGWHFGGRMEKGRFADERLALERDHATALVAAQAKAVAQQKRSTEVSGGYQKRIRELEDAARAVPARVVRVCNEPATAAGRVSAVPAAARGPDAATPRGLPAEARRDPGLSRDIGPDLYRLADDGDQCAAQVTALQEWIRKQAASDTG